MPRMPKLPPPQRRRMAPHNINEPVPMPYDETTVSPHERDVARFRSEDARTGMQTDEVPPTIRMQASPKLSALKNLRMAMMKHKRR